MIGVVGGLLANAFVIFFDFIHVDDPVGAISVHGVAGIWVSFQAFSLGKSPGYFSG